MKFKVSRKIKCNHPLDDAVILVHSFTSRNHMEGQERATFNYYCTQHLGFGRWTITKQIPVPNAVSGLLEALGPED